MNTLRKTSLAPVVVVACAVLVLPLAAAERAGRPGGWDRGGNVSGGHVSGGNGTGGNCQGVLNEYVQSLPLQPLSTAERDGLLFMREEEKLARDVYLMLSLEWDNAPFARIARAEQKHMDAVLMLLDRHRIDDPAQDAIGAFTNVQLQSLYDDLVAQGRESLVAALTIGATVEDLDLADLERQLAVIDQDDLRAVYNNLAKGSRNHLRAFTSALELQGTTYTALFLSPEQVDEISISERETGIVYDADGATLPCGRR